MTTASLQDLHFLRPELLWLLLPAALLCWGLAHTVFHRGQLERFIDPGLLPHLLMKGGERRPLMFAGIFLVLASLILALSGPAWRKLPTPVYSNQDALVILLDLSPSMMATDLSPDRLTRARLKILDILRLRQDGLTALVAYAGEAYVVTPLTEDTATIANLVPALSPRIMPVPGSNIEMAVEQGIQLLQDGANGRGQLLAVTDGIDDAALGTVAKLVSPQGINLSVLAVGSGEGSPIPRGNGGGFITDDTGAIIIAGFDAPALRKLADRSGGRYAQISVNDSDIEYLLSENNAPEQASLTEREFDQWYEEGPLLILLLLPFAALLFRRGTLAAILSPALLLTAGLATTPPASADTWSDLWLRKDQQAKRLLEEGEADEAAKLFQDPQWRGTAEFRAGKFDAAGKAFSQDTAPDSQYNLGNSLVQQQRYEEAIAAYDAALEQAPDFDDARHNREIAEKLRKRQQQQGGGSQQQEQQPQDSSSEQQQSSGGQQDSESGEENSDSDQSGQPQGGQQNPGEDGSEQNNQDQSDASDEQDNQPSDGERQEPGNEEGQQGQNATAEAQNQELDPETQQALDQWLRQIPDDPAGLMREKFKYESLQRRREYHRGEWEPPENGATRRW